MNGVPPAAPPPDLGTPAGRAAYRRELATIARPWRWIGLTLVAAGVILLAALDQPAARLIAVVLIVFGWIQVLLGVVIRTLYHRRRLGGG